MIPPVPFFLEGSTGQLFCVHFPAVSSPAASVLVLPGFAEEMNKCRRMVALAARALQKAGSNVLLIDLLGTGDSAGDFADANLEVWRSDLQCAGRWLADRGTTQLDVLAVRGGGLLFEGLDPPAGVRRGRVALWQPVTNGKQHVSQFLRIGTAERALEAPGGGASYDAHEVLEATGRIEVAGYEITRRLVSELEAIKDPLANASLWKSLGWLEVVAPGVAVPGATSQRALESLRHRGISVDLTLVAGEPFWATPEIAVVPPLIDATVDALVGSPA